MEIGNGSLERYHNTGAQQNAADATQEAIGGQMLYHDFVNPENQKSHKAENCGQNCSERTRNGGIMSINC